MGGGQALAPGCRREDLSASVCVGGCVVCRGHPQLGELLQLWLLQAQLGNHPRGCWAAQALSGGLMGCETLLPSSLSSSWLKNRRETWKTLWLELPGGISTADSDLPA